jgi:hypothetical protein
MPCVTNFKSGKKTTTKTCSCGKEPCAPMRRLGIKCLLKRERLKQREKRLRLKERLAQRKTKKREKKFGSIKYLTKIADILFSKAVKIRDKGRSVKSGLRENLQCAHIHSRSNKAVRWELENAVTLTAGEHLYWAHKHPAEFIRWNEERMGQDNYDNLWNRAHASFKLTPMFIQERITYLKQFIKENNF